MADNGQDNVLQDYTMDDICGMLLQKYQGHHPSLSDVLTLKTTLELTLHNDYGVSSSKFT